MKIAILLSFVLPLVACNCPSEEKYVFSCPVIDTTNNLVAFRDYVWRDQNGVWEKIKAIDSFICSKNWSIKIIRDTFSQDMGIKIKIPFSYGSSDIDLGLMIFCKLLYKKDSLENADCFLYGSLYPNGGQETNSHFYFKDHVVSIISSHILSWRTINLPIDQYKSFLNADFRLNNTILRKKNNLFYHRKNSTPTLVLKSGRISSALLATEFRADLKNDKARLKVWKNNSLILDESIFLDEKHYFKY